MTVLERSSKNATPHYFLLKWQKSCMSQNALGSLMGTKPEVKAGLAEQLLHTQ